MISSAASAASAASKEQRWKTKIIEDYDSEGRNLLTQKGFDPNNVHQTKEVRGIFWTPLTCFCRAGKLKMCRYLVARGADGRQANNVGYFPMYYAAAGGHVEIVRFLAQDGGAHADIQTQNWSGTSPLRVALREDHLCVAKLLIWNDALAPREDGAHSGGIDDAIMRRDLFPNDPRQQSGADHRLALLAWAQEAVTNHDSVVTLFLTGTFMSSSSFRRHPYNPYATRSNKRMKKSSSSLIVFKGKSGILELIAQYIAEQTPQQLRTLRQLTELLPAFIKDAPFVDNYNEE